MTAPWGDTLGLTFASEAEARTVLQAALAVTFAADQPIPTGGSRSAIVAGITEWSVPPAPDRPGTPKPGYWVMLRLRTDRPGLADTLAALAAYTQPLNDNEFAGD